MLLASVCSQPHDCVASMHSIDLVRAHLSMSAWRSATSPLCAWTWLTTTIVCDSVIASTRFDSATLSTTTRRRPCTVKGNSVDVKSLSTVNTRAPSGNDAATRPMSSDTVAPQVTDSTWTLTRPANLARARSVEASQSNSL